MTDATDPAPFVVPHRRRWGAILGFLILFVMPVSIAGAYLWGMAADQYSTEFRFSVRRSQPVRLAPPGEGGSMAAAFAGAPAIAMLHDGQVVVQYLRSRQAMDDVAATVNLQNVYSRASDDEWARLNANLPAEERLRHWRRFVEPRFDLTSGVVTVEVSAFTPEESLVVARAALAAAEKLVDSMTARARGDAVGFAEGAARDSATALELARQRLAAHRNEVSVLSPALAAGADVGLEARLRETLAESRGQLAVMTRRFVTPDAPQLRSIQDRIAVIESELRMVAGRMAGPASEGSTSRASLASVSVTQSSLETDERIAVSAHERAVIALTAARAEAAQQSVYLDSFVRPALPDSARYPIRYWVMLQVIAGALGAWLIITLLYRAVMDHAE